jgi:hypothetical protein
MSKRKKKRARSRAATKRPNSATAQQGPQTVPQPPAFQPDGQEYKYVASDLRKVLVLAVGMFALLIALSFFIR